MIINNNIITVDNSALETFAICPRKFWLRNIQHLVPKRRKVSLSFGASIHAAMFEYYSGKTEKECFKAFVDEARKEGSKLVTYAEDATHIGQQVEYSLEFGIALVSKYVEQHPLENEDFKPLLDADGKPMLEVGFAIELKEGLYIGKIDGIGFYRDRPGIIEHKTTKGTLSNYLRWLNPNNQITGYLKAVQDYLDFDAGECVVNMLRVKDFKRGTPEDNDQKLFSRTSVKRTPQQIDARFRQINLQIKMIKQFLEGGMDSFYMNAPFACNAFGDCEYKPICSLADDADPELVQMIINGGYCKDEWHPYEGNGEPRRFLNDNGTTNIRNEEAVEAK